MGEFLHSGCQPLNLHAAAHSAGPVTASSSLTSPNSHARVHHPRYPAPHAPRISPGPYSAGPPLRGDSQQWLCPMLLIVETNRSLCSDSPGGSCGPAVLCLRPTPLLASCRGGETYGFPGRKHIARARACGPMMRPPTRMEATSRWQGWRQGVPGGVPPGGPVRQRPRTRYPRVAAAPARSAEIAYRGRRGQPPPSLLWRPLGPVPT
jgi:hypothetical protein